ncbi:MAG: hypothetical protein AB2421_02490 [Thermotaleaceae bacterium]
MQITPIQASCVKPPIHGCPQLPGTVFRINIPAGAVINLLNLIEIASPSGICLIIRLPILAGGIGWNTIAHSIAQAGGSIEVL